MASFVLHQGATVLCAHGGAAVPLAPNPRVMLSGQPVVTIASAYGDRELSAPVTSHRQWSLRDGSFHHNIDAGAQVMGSPGPAQKQRLRVRSDWNAAATDDDANARECNIAVRTRRSCVLDCGERPPHQRQRQPGLLLTTCHQGRI